MLPKTIDLTGFSASERSDIGLMSELCYMFLSSMWRTQHLPNRKIAQMQRVFFEELGTQWKVNKVAVNLRQNTQFGGSWQTRACTKRWLNMPYTLILSEFNIIRISWSIFRFHTFSQFYGQCQSFRYTTE